MRLRLLATAVLLPALVACADKDGGSSSKGNDNPVVAQKPADVIRAAAAKNVEAQSARIAMTMEGAGVSMTASGVTATDEVKTSMTMSMDVSGQQIEMEMRMLGQLMFMKMPGLPGGKPWVRLDLEELSKRSDIDLAAITQMQQNDPKQALAYLEGVTDDVKEVGKEDVRGAATTKYEGTLDMRKAVDNQKDKRAKDALKSVVDQLGASTVPMTVWIDAEGRMRKMVQTIDLSNAKTAGVSGTMTTTVEMYDFGVSLDSVVAPPANQVGDGSALFGGNGG